MTDQCDQLTDLCENGLLASTRDKAAVSLAALTASEAAEQAADAAERDAAISEAMSDLADLQQAGVPESYVTNAQQRLADLQAGGGTNAYYMSKANCEQAWRESQ